MKRQFILWCLAFLLAGTGVAQAQQTVRQVEGIVLGEEDNEPVIGAAVQVKGTTLGTVTDVDGKFTLNGIPEALLAMVLVTAIGKALLRVNRVRTIPA